jgi:hypothetical protein
MEDNAGCGWGRRIVPRQRRIVLASIGSSGSDVDEGGDLRVDPNVREDHSGEGVAHEHSWPRLRRERVPHAGAVDADPLEVTFLVFGNVWAPAARFSKGRVALAVTAPINVRRFIVVS